MLAVSLASFFFIMLSSIFGMPISGTHTVISALVGAGIVGCGASNIAWMQVVKIISSWVISPILSSAMCLLLIMICCAVTLGGYQLSLKARLACLSMITGFSFGLTAYMSITLFQVPDSINPLEYIAIPGSFLLGILVSRAILLNLLISEKKLCNFTCKVLMVWDFEIFEKTLAQEQLLSQQDYEDIKVSQVSHLSASQRNNGKIADPNKASLVSKSDGADGNLLAESIVENISSEVLPKKLLKSHVESVGENALDQKASLHSFGLDDFTVRRQTAEKILIYQTYRWLMVMAAMLVCLAHGSNDVANAIAPLIVVSGVYERNERVPYYLGATGISIGLIVLGYKVMETVGKKVVKLDFVKGYCA